MSTNPILLVLRTPPPYGGGEVRSAALREYVAGMPDFVVYEVGSPRRDKSNQGQFAVWKLGALLRDWWRILRLIAKHRPSVLFCSIPQGFPHFFRDSLLILTVRMCGVRVVGELASDICPFFGRGRLRTWYGAAVIRRMSCLRVLGEGIARRLAGYGIANTIVTDNGVGLPERDVARPRKKEGSPRFTFIGTHSPEKGFDVLVGAAASLVGKSHRFSIDCIGEWCGTSFRRAMEARLDELGIKDRFVLHGPVRGTDKWRLLAHSDALVLPSLTEGQPLVLIEAFACGLPVIATKVGGIPEMMEDGTNGLLVDPGSEESLGEAMQTLLQDEVMRRTMSKANPELYRTRFTESMWLESQVAWLRKCASGELHPHGQRFTIVPEGR